MGRKKLKWQPERIDAVTQRVAVIGGWLVIRLAAVDVDKGKKIQFQESMCFVEDKEHEWMLLPDAVIKPPPKVSPRPDQI